MISRPVFTDDFREWDFHGIGSKSGKHRINRKSRKRKAIPGRWSLFPVRIRIPDDALTG
jgi:hypothetical protein